MLEQDIRVLLVEDNDDDVVLTRESFAELSNLKIIDVVANGEELLAYLQNKGKYKQVLPPNMILMDINMPKMNGLEALKEVKADPNLRHIPIVMLTTSNRHEDVLRSYQLGASSFISKPVGFLEFRRVAQQISSYWSETSSVPMLA